MIIKQPKKKKFGWMPNSTFLLKIMQSNLAILAINWIFQGMRGMQSKELSFRILFEIIMIIFFYHFIFINIFDLWENLLFSLISAHSINWLFNTHLWVCVRYFEIYRRNPDSLRVFLSNVSKQIEGISWIDSAVCIGSIGDKGDVNTWRSDIDLRLFFKPGVFNYLKMNFYLLYLRTQALFTIIPLDLYAYNHISFLDNFKKGEGMILIKDADGQIKINYPDKIKQIL